MSVNVFCFVIVTRQDAYDDTAVPEVNLQSQRVCVWAGGDGYEAYMKGWPKNAVRQAGFTNVSKILEGNRQFRYKDIRFGLLFEHVDDDVDPLTSRASPMFVFQYHSGTTVTPS